MENFEITFREIQKISVVHLNGYLDAHTAPDFENALQRLIEQERLFIVVNCSGLHYISSAGLGVFMGVIENIRSRGGDIKLAELTEKVFRVFDLLGFPVLFEIFKEETEAVARFKKS